MKRILIVDDDTTYCTMLTSFLSKQNFQVVSVGSVNKALETLKSASFDLIISDYKMPHKDGMDLLQEIRSIPSKIPVVLMTSYGDVRLAVKAVKLGAFDYLTKPINPSELLVLIKDVFASTTIKEKIIKPPTNQLSSDGEFVEGISKAWEKLKSEIAIVAPTSYSVIIEGESGTGKEFVARKLHQLSLRSDKPFVAIDCGTLTQEMANSELFGHIKGAYTGALNDKIGQFELANSGTLFLDEIGNLSQDVQIKLLRAIQERKIRKLGDTKDISIDVRIIVATNEHLKNAMIENHFREDLYHRLNEFQLNLTPLRQRIEDIPLFSQNYLNQCNIELNKHIKGFDAISQERLNNYYWPGNLRELKNCIRKCALMTEGEYITIESLPSEVVNYSIVNTTFERNDTVNLKVLSKNLEKETILSALLNSNNNKSKAAQLLSIDRKTLYSKIKEYKIDIT
jgi:two-component system, NtrC family, response regulator HydG